MKIADVAYEVAPVAPVVSVNAMLLFGVPLTSWVIILNFVYIIVLLLHKFHKILKEYKYGRK